MLPGKRHRIFVLVACAPAAVVWPQQAAQAADPPRGSVGEGANVGDDIQVLSGFAIRAVNADAEPGESNGCTWVAYVADDLQSPIFESGIEIANSSPFQTDNLNYGTKRLFSATGKRLQAQSCANPAVTGVYAVGTPTSLPELVGRAVNLLDPAPPPPFGTSPPWDDPDRFAVVRIPTWIWIDDPFRSEVLTARANFPSAANPRVWAEATAIPNRIQVDPGDGSGWGGVGDDSNCRGLGEIWNAGMAEDEADCFHIYTRSSAGRSDDAYNVRGRVWFETSWTSNVSAGGPLDPIFRQSAPQPIRVGEILAVSS